MDVHEIGQDLRYHCTQWSRFYATMNSRVAMMAG